MSQENVVLVRSGFAAFEEGNVSRVLDLMADDLVTYRAAKATRPTTAGRLP